MSALARHRSVQNHLRLKRGANRGENDCGDGGGGDRDGMRGGCSLTEAEKVAMVADLVELFQQVSCILVAKGITSLDIDFHIVAIHDIVQPGVKLDISRSISQDFFASTS